MGPCGIISNVILRIIIRSLLSRYDFAVNNIATSQNIEREIEVNKYIAIYSSATCPPVQL